MGKSENKAPASAATRPMSKCVDRYGRIRHLPLREETRRLFDARNAERDADGQTSCAITAREWQVFDLLLTGQSSKQIARELNISHRTVEIHRARLMQKMGVRNTASLIRAALIAA